MSHPGDIPISEYDYALPEDRIAKFPLKQRDQSKLLVYKHGQIEECVFTSLPGKLESGTALVFNNTKVISARLHFLNENGREIEIFCLEPADSSKDVPQGLIETRRSAWNCLVGNLRRWKQEKLILEKNGFTLEARVAARKKGYTEIEFSWQPAALNFAEILKQVGNIPIPPYLNREADQTDQVNYQTMYASRDGSVAAPTAGLHFTPNVMQALDKQNVSSLELTLHVGAGTFQPVKSETMKDHQMHLEWIDVDLDTLEKIKLKAGNELVAVGTTSLRTLESLYWMGLKASGHSAAGITDLEIKQWDPYDLQDINLSAGESISALIGWMKINNMRRLVCRTGILIAPPYNIRMVKGLVTNFHQPKSTLLLLVAAFTGGDWKKIYNYALEHEFRFLSYGDSSLLMK